MAYEREQVSITTTQMVLLQRLLGAYEEVCTEDLQATSDNGTSYGDDEAKRIRAELQTVRNMRSECSRVIEDAAPGFRSHLQKVQAAKSDNPPLGKPTRRKPTRTAKLPGTVMTGNRNYYGE